LNVIPLFFLNPPYKTPLSKPSKPLSSQIDSSCLLQKKYIYITNNEGNMSTNPIASGSVFAKRAGLGPTNSEFTVSEVGKVTFAIGDPTTESPAAFPDLSAPTFSAQTGTGLSASVKNSDAFQLIDGWIEKYMLDTPPAPTSVVSTVDTQKISITFSNPPQKRLAFSPTAVPYIKYIRADVIATSLNASKTWSGCSTVTLESVSGSNSASVTALEMYVDAGIDILSGTSFRKYGGIVSEVPYDIRIYYTNESASSTKYAEILSVATLPVGFPSQPSSLSATPSSSTAVSTSWTKPSDHDSNTEGDQTTPYITTYKVSRAATSSVRYGGVIEDAGDTFTPSTSGSNSSTSLSVSSLHPGTTYSFSVSARNSINASYGTESASASALTSYPSSPAFLSTSDATALSSLTSLQSPYSTSGGYSLDGTTASTPILNYNTLTDSNLRTPSVTSRATNLTPGATGTVGSLAACGGPSSTYTDSVNKGTFSTQGLDVTSPNSSAISSSGSVTLHYSNDRDAYFAGSEDQRGFYKTIDCYACASSVSSSYTASQSPYSIRLQYTPVGGSLLQTPQLQFYIDDSNTATSINNLGIVEEVGGVGSTALVSGVPTFTSSAVFRVQFNQAEIAHYFIRQDKKHADVVITTSSGTALTSTLSITQALMGASHKYYTAPSVSKYTTSSILHNTAGTTLAANPEEIQLNDFTLALNSAGSVFNEGLTARCTPYSLYSNSGGALATGTYLNTSTGASLSLRIDTKSVSADRSAASNASTSTGQHVTSGTGTYPSSGFGDAYDHAVDITTTEELQLVNGTYQSPSVGDGYKNYAASFWCGGLAEPDYTSISPSSSSVRWVTFKFTGRISSGITYSKLRLSVSHSGLTVDYNSLNGANHILLLRVDDPTYPTGWMDCTNTVSGLGVGSGPDGTPCAEVATSTASQRDVNIRAGTGSTATFYVRFGLNNTVAASLTSITVTPVSSF
jgi:hypothetical protein